MSAPPAIAVVVAVKGALDNLGELLANIGCGNRKDAEFIFACAGAAPVALPRHSNCTILELPVETLVPELWGQGIRAASAGRVALIATHCAPSADWFETVAAADLDAHVGVGGAIELSPACGAAQRAVYLLRYSNFTSRRPKGVVTDIAADNAVYRRGAIMEHQDLLADGFWEPSFHRRFSQQGLKLLFDPALTVTYRGDEAPNEFMRARFQHGREYGFSRAKSSSPLLRLGFVVASPLIAPLTLARVSSRAFGQRTTRGALLSAFPWLTVFALAWSCGEAAGYLGALAPRQSENAAT